MDENATPRAAETSFIGRVTTPIAALSRRNVPENIASGIYIAVGNRRFIVTAAHMILSLGKRIPHVSSGPPEPRTIPLPGEESWPCIESDKITDDDPIDVLVTVLSEEACEALASVEFLPLSQVEVGHIAEPQMRYRVAGYPSSRTKANAATETIHNEFISLDVAPILDRGRWPANARDDHLVVEFDRPAFVDEQGRRREAPHPGGMSGCGIWLSQVGDEDSGRPRLVGVATDYCKQEQVIRGTRIDYALMGMACLCPDVTDSIREAGLRI